MHDDQATFDGWRYLHDRRIRRDRRNQQRMAQRHPAVAVAHRLFRKVPTLQRAEIEARLLVRQADEAIASRCGLSAAAVAAYHDLFFNFRDAFDAHVYIYSVAIDPTVFIGLTEDDADIFLQMLGCAPGPLIVDAALRYFRKPPDHGEQRHRCVDRQSVCGRRLVSSHHAPGCGRLQARPHP